MAPVICGRCGSPAVPGARFCAQCGSPLPVPVATGPTPTSPPGPSLAASPPPVRTTAPPLKFQPRRTWIVAAVVAAAVAVTALVLVLAAVPTVTVTAIDFSSVDNACGANDNDLDTGFSIRANSVEPFSVTVVNTDPNASCTVHSLTATTPGFALTGVNVPLTVGPNGNATLSFTIHGPASGYDGVLAIDVE
jgi:zinc-ribbon domain